MDSNYYLRSELVRDAQQQCESLGSKPDAVLVSGDIAFAGEPEEYSFAQTWFEELCKACKCSTEDIIVIPGNHDVQRDVARKPLIQAVHEALKKIEPNRLLKELSDHLNDEDSRDQLYRSIANYNDFAAQYLCNLYPPDRTKVERDFILNDGSILRVTGLNSAFVSSHKDLKGKLFVDPASFTLTKEIGVTHLVLCHHPYDWLANGKELEDHLSSVSQVQLFGHEHTNRVMLNRDCVSIAASAAHPERAEYGWEPGYNLLDLSVNNDSNGKRTLNVSAHVRIWQSRPGQFVPKMDRSEHHFTHNIPLEPWIKPVLPIADELSEATTSKVTTDGYPVDAAHIEEERAMTSLRALSIKFFKLTFSQKHEIAGGLSLYKDEDKRLPDHERFRQVLLRAKERDLLLELETKIDSAFEPTVLNEDLKEY